MISRYRFIRDNINEKINSGEITYQEARSLNTYAYERCVECERNPELTLEYLLFDAVITEAESDHPKHMKMKENAAKFMGKDPQTLNNKKYKNPESSRKADLKYNYKEGKMEGKHVNTTYNEVSNTNVHITKDSPKESDMRLLAYMKKHSDLSKPEEAKKYRAAFQMFCNKFGIDKNSSLYVKYNIDGNNRIRMVEWSQSEKMDKKKLDRENKTEYTVPSGYCLIHKCRTPNLTQLEPRKFSNKYIGDGHAGTDGQYHPTGRIYFVLAKEDNLSTGNWGKGNCVYKLVSNISGFYIDYEQENSRSSDRYGDAKKLIGRAVYVKTDKPLKVKQIK